LRRNKKCAKKACASAWRALHGNNFTPAQARCGPWGKGFRQNSFYKYIQKIFKGVLKVLNLGLMNALMTVVIPTFLARMSLARKWQALTPSKFSGF
jgi:hypothetical protein